MAEAAASHPSNLGPGRHGLPAQPQGHVADLMPAEASSRRFVPSTHGLLSHPAVAALRADLSHDLLADLVRGGKARLLDGTTRTEAVDAVVDDVVRRAAALRLPARRLVNATGVVVHTGLGTSMLSPRATERVLEAAGHTQTAAYGPWAKTRTVERLLRVLTGAEAACVTGQNAATCTLLVAVAQGWEIVCASRDLIEISRGVRLLDLIETAGARVVAVGAANSVYLEDYQAAMTEKTALILRVWHSNYAATGYVAHVTTQELAELAHSRHVPLVVNLGAGSLVDLREKGLPYSPTIQEIVWEGADLVLASGDKLIGGPQSGIAVGRADVVRRLVSCPFYRAVRPAKLDVAALEGTLASYVAGRAWEEVPTLRLLAAPVESLVSRARALAAHAVTCGFDAEAHADAAVCGGAILPGVTLPTWAVRLRHGRLSGPGIRRALAGRGVVARHHAGAVTLDLRSVLPEQDETLIRAMASIAAEHGGAAR